jgi:hypothetical protein
MPVPVYDFFQAGIPNIAALPGSDPPGLDLGFDPDEEGRWYEDNEAHPSPAGGSVSDTTLPGSRRRDGVRLVRASDVPMEQVEYLHDPLIPLRVTTLMVGLDGVGKSTVLHKLAAAATRGSLRGVFDGSATDVVIASSEDHPPPSFAPGWSRRTRTWTVCTS